MNFALTAISKLNVYVGTFLILAPLVYVFILIPLAPTKVSSNTLSKLETNIITSVLDEEGEFGLDKGIKSEKLDLIRKAEKNYISIDSIGLSTQLFEGDNYRTLEKGIWRMPSYASPRAEEGPVVIAGHRWGEDTFTYEHRVKNLFLKLPEVKVGDIITLDWNFEIYKYRVIDKDQSNHVKRLADLILITCVDYTSPVRIFIYAEKI